MDFEFNIKNKDEEVLVSATPRVVYGPVPMHCVLPFNETKHLNLLQHNGTFLCQILLHKVFI